MTGKPTHSTKKKQN